MKAVILAGGAGDRLWPLSRRNFPKQFLQQGNGNSLFQETVIRNIPYCDEMIVLTNRAYLEIVEGQLQGFQGIPYRLILEEEAKGTAPAIAVASLLLEEEESVFVLPTDLLLQGEGYSDAIYRAKRLSDAGRIVLFGIPAEGPVVTYGYIRRQGETVTRFVEKPSQDVAERIFADDDILWNSGLLLCANSTLRQELGRQSPSLMAWAKEVAETMRTAGETHSCLITKEALASLERTHLEKVLLETSENLSVVPLRCDWQDISNFEAYRRSSVFGEERNAIQMACDNTTVINVANHRLVVANGLKDVFIVNTEDAVYISKKDVEQNIKGLIASGAGQYDDFFQYNPKTYRSWGTREVISQAAGYRVRKLELYPGAALSSHRHVHRNENYSVIKGELSLEIDGRIEKIAAGESINVLPGQMHRLYNETDEVVVAIEVDTGAEIDERDMVHQEDTQTQEQLPQLYRLSPAYKDYLWGGSKLVTLFGKNSPYEITAESWELSAHRDGQSTIADGPFQGIEFGAFVKRWGSRVCGWKSKTFDRFPILIKFIDARKPLSVQIHPYDDYAFVHEREFGKNEMWYIMDASPEAFLYCGFERDVTKEEVRESLAAHTILDLLHKVQVKKGDVLFIPAGTIHAIGEGILLCEVQQNSNSTYRVYDYQRLDKNGAYRPLHIDKAMDVMTTTAYVADAYGWESPEEIVCGWHQQLCVCKYFACNKYAIEGSISIYMDDASFVSVVFLQGTAVLECEGETMDAAAGDSIFVSAGRKVLKVTGDCEFIVTNI